MNRIDYLPLGSVVYLNEGTKKLLIVSRGLLTKRGDDVVFFDYGGVLYPEGITDDTMAYFQHDAIRKVVFEGYRDDDDEATVEKINGFLLDHPEVERGTVDNWNPLAEISDSNAETDAE